MDQLEASPTLPVPSDWKVGRIKQLSKAGGVQETALPGHTSLG